MFRPTKVMINSLWFSDSDEPKCDITNADLTRLDCYTRKLFLLEHGAIMMYEMFIYVRSRLA